MESFGLSKRGAANVEAIWPRISAAVEEREDVNKQTIDMGTSENWLLREEVIQIYKQAVQNGLQDKHLSYPDGFAGSQDLIAALVSFFNTHFKPLIPVAADHIATATGAAFSLDSLLYNICEAGDGLLVPTPCWNGFDWLLNVRAGVKPVFVRLESFDDVFSLKLVEALETAFSEAAQPIRGVLFTNPNNPFGQCYPVETIQAVIKFCHAKGIHFISDEIYALSRFESPDLPNPVPFVSALQIDVQAIGCDLSRVHTIWSTSKDFGSSGLRMGCCITQGNKRLRTGLALSSNTQMSALTALATTHLLNSADMPRLLDLNARRLGEAYKRLTSMLKSHNVQYIPAHMGPFIFVRVASHVETPEQEAQVIKTFKDAGLSVSAGRGYHIPEKEKGWARINFALLPDVLTEALGRLDNALKVISS